jgi:REP element-mobilizing transposase RayT
VVTHQRECLFGEIVDGVVRASAHGEIVSEEWLRSALVRPEIELDTFVVMPNHIHGILIVRDQSMGDGAHGRAHKPSRPRSAPVRAPRSLGSFVAGFKAAATKRINALRGTPGVPVWQRNYYEHVIRNEEELNRIRQYIMDNPAGWAEDPENATSVGAHGRAPLPRAKTP